MHTREVRAGVWERALGGMSRSHERHQVSRDPLRPHPVRQVSGLWVRSQGGIGDLRRTPFLFFTREYGVLLSPQDQRRRVERLAGRAQPLVILAHRRLWDSQAKVRTTNGSGNNVRTPRFEGEERVVDSRVDTRLGGCFLSCREFPR
jgi:hypothetical protein